MHAGGTAKNGNETFVDEAKSANFVPTDFRSLIHCEQPNSTLTRFNGFM